MKHLADKLDPRWFVWILLFKVHDQTEGPILERCIHRPYYDSIPSFMYVSPFGPQVICMSRDAYQVMTLSAMGEAETPAGGSVCIRCMGHLLATRLIQALFVVLKEEKGLQSMGGVRDCWGTQYFEVTHETPACRCSHFEAMIKCGASLEMM